MSVRHPSLKPLGRIGLVVASMLLMGAAPWGDLHEWIGRYPTDRSVYPARRLLAMPAVAAALRRLLSPADRALLTAYGIELPVAEKDGFVLVSQCRPHDCGDANAMVAIDTREPRLWVGFFAASDGIVSTRWYGPTDAATLPQAVLEAFAAQHGS